MRTVFGIVFVLGMTGVWGCGPSKVTECNSLIDVINKGVESLKTNQKAADPAADFKATADAMDKVAAEASQVKLKIPELQKFAADYVAMAKEVAKAAREVVTALESKDVAKMTAAQANYEKAGKQEDPLVESINKFCTSP